MRNAILNYCESTNLLYDRGREGRMSVYTFGYVLIILQFCGLFIPQRWLWVGSSLSGLEASDHGHEHAPKFLCIAEQWSCQRGRLRHLAHLVRVH